MFVHTVSYGQTDRPNSQIVAECWQCEGTLKLLSNVAEISISVGVKPLWSNSLISECDSLSTG